MTRYEDASHQANYYSEYIFEVVDSIKVNKSAVFE